MAKLIKKGGRNIVTTASGTTESAAVIISDGGNIGSTSDPDAISIATGGNVTLTQDLIVSGDMTVSGDTTTVNTSTISVEDPLMILAANNGASDTVDIGVYGLYDTSGSQDLYSGLFRDATDGKWKLFKDNQAVPTTTVDTSGTGYTVASLVANLEGDVTLSSPAASRVLVTSGSGVISSSAVTSTELGILDGGTAATSTTLVDADRVVANDDGSMVQVAMSDIKTYINAGSGGAGGFQAYDAELTSVAGLTISDYVAGLEIDVNDYTPGDGGRQYGVDTQTAVDPNNTNKFVISYRDGDNSDYGTTKVGTIVANTISYGTASVHNSDETYTNCVQFDPAQAGRFVVHYKNEGGSPTRAGHARVGTVATSGTGTTITWGTAVQHDANYMNAADGGSNTLEFDPSRTDGKYVYLYETNIANNEYPTRAVIGTVTDDAVAFGTISAHLGGTATNNGPFRYGRFAFDPNNEGKFVVIWRDTDNSDYGTLTVGTCDYSAGTISWGTDYVFESSEINPESNRHGNAIVFLKGQDKKFAIFYNKGNNYGYGRICEYSGTTIDDIGTEYEHTAQYRGPDHLKAKEDPDKSGEIALLWQQASYDLGYMRLVTFSGTETMTFGDYVRTNDADTGSSGIRDTCISMIGGGTHAFVGSYFDYDDSSKIKAFIGTVGKVSPTLGYGVDTGQGIRFTGSGDNAELISITNAGKALLDDANAAAQRETLGIVEGQPLDADLTAIAGLTSAADKGIQFTGSGTAGVYDLTAAGKALLDDADASAQRTTLGLAIGTDVQAFDSTIVVDADIGTTVQAQDADLAAIAGLTSAADKGIQFTGSGTAATYDLTAAGKALLDDANASAQRTTLGLVIGTDVQAQDADLTAIAGLTSAADKGIQFTGSGTAGVYTLTTAGKALLDDASASAQRTTLGLGSLATAASITTSEIAAATLVTASETIGSNNNDTTIPTSAAVKAYADAASSGGVAGHVIQNAASNLTARTNLNFDGTHVIATDDSGNSQTDVALSTNLQALSGLTSAADKGIQYTGSGTAGVYTLTTAGKALLDDANASAQRTTLGLGTAATRAAEDTLTDGSNLPDGAAIKAYGDSNWAGGGGSAHTIENAGTGLTARSKLNFDGTHVIATDDSGDDASDITLSTNLQASSGLAFSGFTAGMLVHQQNQNPDVDYEAGIGLDKNQQDVGLGTDPNNPGKFIITFSDYNNSGYGTARVGTATANTIAYGAASRFNGNVKTYSNKVAYDPNQSGRFIVMFKDNGDSRRGKGIVGTVASSGTGDTISWGSEVQHCSTYMQSGSSGSDRKVKFDTKQGGGKFVYLFETNIANNEYPTVAQIGTVTGDAVAFGTISAHLGGTAGNNGPFRYGAFAFDPNNAGKFVVVWSDNDNSGYGTLTVGTCDYSAGTISWGTDYVFESSDIETESNKHGNAICFLKDQDKKFAIFYNKGNHYGYGRVCEYSGTTIDDIGTETVHTTQYRGCDWIMAEEDPDSGGTIALIYHALDGEYLKLKLVTISGTTMTFATKIGCNDNAAGEATVGMNLEFYGDGSNKFIAAYQERQRSGGAVGNSGEVRAFVAGTGNISPAVSDNDALGDHGQGVRFTATGTAETFKLTTAGLKLLDDASASAQRTTLGLGTSATRAAEDTLTDGSNLPDGAAIKAYGDANWAGGGGAAHTIENAGTGLTARSKLNFDGTHVIATDDSGDDASDITLSTTLQNVSTGGTTARTALGLTIGTDVQAYDQNLGDIAGFSSSPGNGYFIVGSGTAFVLESAGTARTSLGLGTAATRASEDTLTDGSNLPDGAAIKAYGDANWAGGGGGSQHIIQNLTTNLTARSYLNVDGTHIIATDNSPDTDLRLSTNLQASSGLAFSDFTAALVIHEQNQNPDIDYSYGLRYDKNKQDGKNDTDPNNPGKFIVTFSDYSNSGYGTARVGTISANTISYGTGSRFNGNVKTHSNCVAYDPAQSGRFVVMYRDEGDSRRGKGIVGTVASSGTGTTISWGTEVQHCSTYMQTGSSGSDRSVKFDTKQGGGKFVYLFDTNIANNEYPTVAQIGTVSGDGVTFGTISAHLGGTAGNNGPFRYGAFSFDPNNAGKFVVVWTDNDNSDYGTLTVGTCDYSAGTISWGTDYVFESSDIETESNRHGNAICFLPGRDKTFAIFYNTDNHEGFGRVCTYSGTTINSVGSRYSHTNSWYGCDWIQAECDPDGGDRVVLMWQEAPYDAGRMQMVTISGTVMTFAARIDMNDDTNSSNGILSTHISFLGDGSHKFIGSYEEEYESGSQARAAKAFLGSTGSISPALTDNDSLGDHGQGIRYTAVGTAETFKLTTAGLKLLDDGDAAAQRTTLGLGALSTAASITTSEIAAATLITASETIASNDNDTTIPTSAAVKALTDSLGSGHTIENAGTGLTARSKLNFDGTHLIATDDSGDDASDITLSTNLQASSGLAFSNLSSGLTIDSTDYSYGLRYDKNKQDSKAGVDPNNKTKFVITYSDYSESGYGKARVGTVTKTAAGGSIAYGTASKFNGNVRAHGNSIAYDPAQAGRFVIMYRDEGDSRRGKGIVGTVASSGTGDTITWGSETQFCSTYLQTGSSGSDRKVRFDTKQGGGKFVFLFDTNVANNEYPTRAIIGTVSGTAVSFGTVSADLGGTAGNNGPYRYGSFAFDPDNAGKFVVMWTDNDNSDYGTLTVGTCDYSAGTISWGTDYVFESSDCETESNRHTNDICFIPGRDKTFAIFYTTDNHEGFGRVITYSGTTINSVGSRYSHTNSWYGHDWISVAGNPDKEGDIVLMWQCAPHDNGHMQLCSISGTVMTFATQIDMNDDTNSSNGILATNINFLGDGSGKFVGSYQEEIESGSESRSGKAFIGQTFTANPALSDNDALADHGQGVRFTGTGAAETFKLTTAGLKLLDDANAAAQRTTLGLGSASERAAEDTLTNGSNLPDGAAIKTYGDTNWGGTLTTKGDLSSFTTTGARLPVGSNDDVLTADSSAAAGVAWKAAGGGGGHTIENAGTGLTARSKLNFDGTHIIATDDSGDDASDITLSTNLQASSGLTLSNFSAGMVVHAQNQNPDVDYEAGIGLDKNQQDVGLGSDPNNTDKFIITYSDYDNSGYGTARVGTISANTISYGTASRFNGNVKTYSNKVAFDPNNAVDGRFVVMFKDNGDSRRGKGIVGTVASSGTGTTITWGSETQHCSTYMQSGSSGSDRKVQFDTKQGGGKFVYLFETNIANNEYPTVAQIGTVTGDGLAFGTISAHLGGTAGNNGPFRYGSFAFDPNNAGKFVVVWSDNDNSGYGTLTVGTCNYGAGTISWGTDYVFESSDIETESNKHGNAICFLKNEDKKFAIFYNKGNHYGYGRVCEYSGTTIDSIGTETVHTTQYRGCDWIAAEEDPDGPGTVALMYHALDGEYLKLKLVTISGTTMTFATKVGCNDNAAGEATVGMNIAFRKDGSHQFVACYQERQRAGGAVGNSGEVRAFIASTGSISPALSDNSALGDHGQGIRYTGTGVAETFKLTSAGLKLLDDADAAAQRATLGIVASQPLDADLTAIAGLTSAADKGIQFTGSGTAGVYDLTAAGKALLDDADAAAQRTTLGLGTSAITALPLTTKGDLETYTTTQARLPVGTNDHVLTADSSAAAGVAWKAAAGGGGGGTLTTKGDIESYTTSQERLAVGTNNYVLTADSSAAAGVAWKLPNLDGYAVDVVTALPGSPDASTIYFVTG